MKINISVFGVTKPNRHYPKYYYYQILTALNKLKIMSEMI
jgi:hypothetical protein